MTDPLDPKPLPRGCVPALVGLLLALILAVGVHHALADAQTSHPTLEQWGRLARCETNTNWKDGGQYGGGFGIYIGTWRAFGGTQYAPRPQDASAWEQIVVAHRIWQRYGFRAWGCGRYAA